MIKTNLGKLIRGASLVYAATLALVAVVMVNHAYAVVAAAERLAKRMENK